MPAHKTQDGRRWQEYLDFGSDPATGKRIRKKVEAKTKRLCEIKATALRERHRRGEDISAKPRTLDELVNEWLTTIAMEGSAENTILAYASANKNQIKPYLGATFVPKLNTRAIQNVVNDLAKRYAPTYIRTIKTVLVQALDFAIEQGERSDNPAKAVRIPAVKQGPGRSLTPEEIHALLPVCEQHPYGLAIRLALNGLRRSELPGLRWDDFDEVTGTLMVRRQIQRVGGKWTPIETKNKKPRVLTLGPKLVAALRQHRWNQATMREDMGWEDCGYIFISRRNGGVCPPPTIYKAWREIAKAAGVAPTRLHNCRHTAATTLIGDGVDIASVSGVLGHASPQITLGVYAHALPDKVAGASKRLEDLYE